MAEVLKPVTPRNMRPRSTPNAEINAQQGDEFRYQQGVFQRPEVKDVPPKGYAEGGRVRDRGVPPYGAAEPNTGKIIPEQARLGAQYKPENWDYGGPYTAGPWRGGIQPAPQKGPRAYHDGGPVLSYEKGGKVVPSKPSTKYR